MRATTVQGSNWTDDCAQFFGEDVIVVPDNDDKGRENARSRY
jgi:hypothetical protein